MNRKYIVVLNAEDRQYLENLTSSGTLPARQMMRAQILLKSDQQINCSYEQIAAAYDVSHVTIALVRKTFMAQGLDAALQRKKPARRYARVLDGEGEAHLIALACSAPPSGRAQWSLRLLGERFVQLEYADAISHETVRRVLKKTNSSRG